ncbi:RidA family protein [Pseudorhizobium pelagicum]|uniref:Endoribonuclease L-PSP n=1 Tax=Pseudorhizobium pelagicum TaxID=1509405 RepID=A0A922P4G7_9HYPH|nr:RidA family protein [Pseudorhizobium pelagicum]KEQ03724.1 endoribonuclease L-PSP [Pseudorhizobium pelagicum]KEQ08220.1 endoribonuclease L-PSP [Pseudorhizobium pelagicum]
MKPEEARNDLPIPQGLYVPAVRRGDMIFTAGMTPRHDGVLQFSGIIAAAADPAQHAEAVLLSCGNALAAAEAQLHAGEKISAILSLTVYIAAEPGFTAHSKLADYASQFLKDCLGDAAIGTRAAIGVATLPGNAPVEIQLIAAV